jgi:hypothetical protein
LVKINFTESIHLKSIFLTVKLSGKFSSPRTLPPIFPILPLNQKFGTSFPKFSLYKFRKHILKFIVKAKKKFGKRILNFLTEAKLEYGEERGERVGGEENFQN